MNEKIRNDNMLDYAQGFATVFSSGFDGDALDQVKLEQLFSSSWIPNKICTLFAEDMTSKGVEWLIDPDDAEFLDKEFERFKIWQQLADAITWARLYGGALIEIRMKDNQPKKPLNPKGVFSGLRVFDRYEAAPNTQHLTLGGEPSSYNVNPSIYHGTYVLDASRAIRIIGKKLPNRLAAQNELWGESYVQILYETLLRREGTNIGVSELMKRCYIRFLGIKNFWKAMGSSDPVQANNIVKAAKIINDLQNISSLIVADTEDTFQTQTFSFGGFKDIFDQNNQDIAGATDIPLVRLFGMSPVGFSTGETDLQNYANAIAREQENQLRYAVFKIASVILESNNRSAENLRFEFVPIIQPTQVEKSQQAQQSVQTILQVYEAGLITADRALSEIKRQSETTGFFASVTLEEIEALKEPAIPLPEGMGEGEANGGV